ncbi:MAG: Stp1/IreP family PP2C-type Ser/Thr phosphatase [Gammaproteobacteria bacterium]|nr:Stp1/IreP family PP2C-type Ser/Thr phosphatase [Gammaproteobacteria bacterium]
MGSQFKLEVANVSDVGCIRPHNEDSTASNEALGILVLADGMGGYKAGEVASALAVTNIYNDVISGLQNSTTTGIDEASGLDRHSILLRDAVNNANSSIYKTAQEDEQCHGMGTTVVTAIAFNDRISIANVGDSRLYRLRADDFKQITKDHSLVQELIDRGLFSPEEAEKNAPKNLVTRALGLDSKVEVDIIEDQIAADDIYLLCSDGLTDMVKDEEIHLTLSKYSANLVPAAEKLVEIAKKYGGKDNISVILARISE